MGGYSIGRTCAGVPAQIQSDYTFTALVGAFGTVFAWAITLGTAVWLHRLIPAVGEARSLVVRSATGYSRRFGVDDLAALLLATRAGGRPLRAGHGAPLRLVVPDRRGFWWVKWVTAVELSSAPSWWQPPFPLR